MNCLSQKFNHIIYPLLSTLLIIGMLAGCGSGGGASSGSGKGLSSEGASNPNTSNEAPIVTIGTPISGSTVIVGEQVLFMGTADDPEDGPMASDALSWTSDIDGILGSGDSLSIFTLSLGTHNVTLTATDLNGAIGSDSVFLRVTEPAPAREQRVGEINPYAGKIQRLPEKLDDELIVIRHAITTDETSLGIIDDPVSLYGRPSSDPVAPRITARNGGRVPVAAAAGRILGAPLHQAAFVGKPSGGSSQFLLEVFGLDDPGRDLIAEYSFAVPFPDGEFAVTVADIDAFNEKPGNSNNENDQFFDEVVLAYPELIGGELLATIKVLSFETAEFPQNRAGPPTTATTERTITTTQPMLPSSRLVVRHGDNVSNREVGPHIIVGYLNAQRQIAIDVFKYLHSRDDLNQPDPTTDTRTLRHLLHQIISPPLTEEAAAAGGWDLVVERGERLGIDNPLDVKDIIIVAYHQNGLFVQDAWVLEDLDGFPNPISLAGTPQSFEFARVEAVGTLPEIPFTILPNSKLRAVTGRILGRNLTNDPIRCESIGLIVLADTNRGPAVQSMKSFIADVFLGSVEFGPASPQPTWWPDRQDHIFNPIDRTELSNTYLASGGFVSDRNGLIDDRGNPSGTGRVFISDCDDVDSSPFLGQMPSFYVAHPDLGELHSVTLSGGTPVSGRQTVAPLEADIGDGLLLFAADADGDAAYYRSQICLDNNNSNCRRLFFGDAELHYAIENIETSNVILQQPPKHIDYLPTLGGMTNVSMSDDFFAEFAQTDVASGSITRKGKTDWSIGARVGIGIGAPTPPGGDFSSVFNMSLDAEHQTVRENFNARETTVSLTQTTGAISDDVVWSKTQSIDYWRFPAQGGKPVGGAAIDGGFADEAYVEVAVPDEPVTLIGPGTLNESYQPTHQVGNILSYPTFSGDVQDIGELFNFLGSYVPADENGTRQCKPVSDTDPNGCIVVINDQLERVAEVLAGQEFAGGEFQTRTNPIDVAEVLQIGGTSYTAELEFTEDVRSGQSVTNTDSIKAEANLKIPLVVPVQGVPIQFGELEEQLRAATAFENAEISENSMGTKTRIVLHIPGTIPTQRSYQIRPSFGFTPGGSLNLGFQVNARGTTQSFWEQHYSAPDPALNMPFRIVRKEPGSNEFELGIDFTRNRIKGFFVRDGAGIDPSRPDDSVGRVLDAVPLAGDPVQLEVHVTNLSVGTAVENLVVEFSAQESASGSLIGNPIRIGETTIRFLPYRGQFDDEPNGHIQSAYVIWDTDGFGPPQGTALRSWVIYVTLDPGDQIRDETHELFDRFDDPLRAPTGEVLDPGFEKGQNNHGWSMVRIAPSLIPEDNSAAANLATGDRSQIQMAAGSASQFDDQRSQPLQISAMQISDGKRPAKIEGAVGEPIEISIVLQSETLTRNYGMLRIFDGHPDDGAEMLIARSVQGLSGGTATIENFAWRTRSVGTRVLYATYTGGGTDDRIIVPIPVRIY